MEQHSSSPVIPRKERRSVKLIHHDHDVGILLRAKSWEIEHPLAQIYLRAESGKRVWISYWSYRVEVEVVGRDLNSRR